MEASSEMAASSAAQSEDRVINLDRGDPTSYQNFWRESGEAAFLKIEAWENMSYFSNRNNICWFLLPVFETEIRRIHRIVGNAVADKSHHIVIGNGSSQLFQAALFALSTQPGLAETGGPMPVVSAAPYYSGYPAATDFLKSTLYKWAGDANTFTPHPSTPYIEVICSPNNPDGRLNNPVLPNQNSYNIHDLAYYWPQYTPITKPADHHIMLFTISKCTGHAGCRLGWAVVKDADLARRMVKFVELGTIGVSKDSQHRAAAILRAVSNGYERGGDCKLFDFGRKMMAERWERVRGAVEAKGAFGLPEYPPPSYCGFFGEETTHLPAFAWLKYEGDQDIEDIASYLKTEHSIEARGGRNFGTTDKYVRISLLERQRTFDAFIERLSSIS